MIDKKNMVTPPDFCSQQVTNVNYAKLRKMFIKKVGKQLDYITTLHTRRSRILVAVSIFSQLCAPIGLRMLQDYSNFNITVRNKLCELFKDGWTPASMYWRYLFSDAFPFEAQA